VLERRLLLPGRVRESVTLFAGGREAGVGTGVVAFWKSSCGRRNRARGDGEVVVVLVTVGAGRGGVGAGQGEVGVVSEGRLLLPGRVREGVALVAGRGEAGVGDGRRGVLEVGHVAGGAGARGDGRVVVVLVAIWPQAVVAWAPASGKREC